MVPISVCTPLLPLHFFVPAQDARNMERNKIMVADKRIVFFKVGI